MSEIYNIDIDTIEKIADIVSSRELSEITIQDGEKSVTIKGKKCPPPPAMPFSAPMGITATPAPAVPVAEDKSADTVSGNIVKSPIVGTFYVAPSPDKPAFVKVGDKVKKGDVIMIIESMKLMNEIQSDFDGVVEKILVSDGQAVEYDQPIMIIK
ncbi:MAG: acetyl-CoA carboxylase biotin carboxyl carrier protein [Ruminococcus sp.]|nr:acetyl-CoA carboxylase biotin carboxyl carrier protein [Ruminococcus sp.]MDE6678776.1 acetyl-CoA carboxylase biotin carboxyl carrier protein [Ruminococcus sp.]